MGRAAPDPAAASPAYALEAIQRAPPAPPSGYPPIRSERASGGAGGLAVFPAPCSAAMEADAPLLALIRQANFPADHLDQHGDALSGEMPDAIEPKIIRQSARYAQAHALAM